MNVDIEIKQENLKEEDDSEYGQPDFVQSHLEIKEEQYDIEDYPEEYTGSCQNENSDTEIKPIQPVFVKEFYHLPQPAEYEMPNPFLYKPAIYDTHPYSQKPPPLIYYQQSANTQPINTFKTIKDEDEDNENGEELQCTLCGKNFLKMSYLRQHTRKYHNGEMPLKCSFCDERFASKRALKSHEKTHNDGKPYECTICKRTFALKHHVTMHIRLHTGEKPYKCTVCEQSFAQRHHLKTHIRTHTGEKPYKCEWCGHAFSQIGLLKTHLRTHTGEKPYKCMYCDQAFHEQSNLKTHERKHTGEKPFKCKICGEMFATHSKLHTHEKKHGIIKMVHCKYCNKEFPTRHLLQIHIRVHTGEKPYECSMCGHFFNARHHVIAHEKVHLDGKPYKKNISRQQFLLQSCLQESELIEKIEKPQSETQLFETVYFEDNVDDENA
ncbi:zinc finger protein 501-like [Chrysoperla carnea]|uniref:zinc finger protein 501-like n=1 Tax=Chrysoperla carnea TaxID=189513 RepID=UPI001D06FB38|nr:zinc finger protein 501-like [Chrysoperla carnea]XP_044742479.1 zinc finger protein 501-like [Chrysoperla carnea]